ncbi:hypothetical protein HK102_004103 [Quaeritorhiza haematococci]|nr:hypothetical protein HK102_004103 [Quaeritorhiza haematococci]
MPSPTTVPTVTAITRTAMDPQNSISPASPNAHNPLLNLPVELLLQIICHWYTLEDVRVYSKNPMPVQYVVKLASTSKDFFQHIYGTGVFWRRITFAQKYQPDRPAFYPRVTDAVVHNMVKNMRQAGSEAPESALTAVHAINLQSTNISAASILELMQSFPNLAVLNVIRCPKVDVFDLRNRFKAWVGCDGASAEVKVSLATMTSPSIKPTTKLESLSLRGVGSGNNKYKHKASTSDESRAKKIFDAVDNILDRIGRILAPNTSFQRKEHLSKECDGFDEKMADEENTCEHEVEETNYFSQLRCVNEPCAETYTYWICADGAHR